MQQGFVLFDGPSQIDGNPIVAIVTGLGVPTRNRKTGALAQIYILRSDMHPIQAVQTGDDVSICGACVHRGRIVTDDMGKRRNVERSCYVTLIHGPHGVYKHFRDGFYGDQVPLAAARRILAGRMVRIGAYGDPAAVPIGIWQVAIERAAGVTAYTHLWRDNPALASFCMASVDTEAERIAAVAMGFRTFRVRCPDTPLMKGEAHCPNAMDSNVQCVSCMLCGGKRKAAKADIAIPIHGTGKIHFLREAV